MTNPTTDPNPPADTKYQGDVLTILRQFDATPEEVFVAWTDPQELIQWWGPEGMDIPNHALDVKKGGSWKTTMRNAEGVTNTCSGEYLEISPHSRLVFTWGWIMDGVRGHESMITVEFQAVGGGTQMRFEQRSFPDADSHKRHDEGWTSSFECLKQHLS